MADLKLTVDVKSVADARKQLNDFQKAANSLSVNRLVSGVNSIENSIKQLVQARSKDVISQRTYRTGLQELAAAYQKMGYSAAKAEAMVRAYANQVRNQAAAQQAARAAEELARAQQQAAERTRQLRLRFQEGYAAFDRARKQMRDLREALRQGIINTDQYREAVRRLREEQQRAGDGAGDLARRMNRQGVITQQAGYQLGDFIVQVQSGTNWMVAFGQQATQVVGTLTLLGGKWILIGSVLGVAIPLITAVGAAFMRTRGEGQTLDQVVNKLKESFSELSENMGLVGDAELDLRFGNLATEVRNLASAMVELNAASELNNLSNVLDQVREAADANFLQILREGFSLPGYGEINQESPTVRERANESVFENLGLPQSRREFLDQISRMQEFAEAGDREGVVRIFEEMVAQIREAEGGMAAVSQEGRNLVAQMYQASLSTAETNAMLNGTAQEAERAAEQAERNVEAYEELLELTREQQDTELERASNLYQRLSSLRQETQLQETIARYGEQSAQVAELRAEQEREIVRLEAMKAGFFGESLRAIMDQYDAMVLATDEAEKTSAALDAIADLNHLPFTAQVEALADMLGIAADEATRLLDNLPVGTTYGVGLGEQGLTGAEAIFGGQEGDIRASRRGGRGGGGTPEFVSRVFGPELQQAIEQAQEDLRLYNQEVQMLDSALQAGLVTQQEYNSFVAQAQEVYNQAQQGAYDYQKALEQVEKTAMSSMENAFMSIIDGSKSASEAFKDMARQILAEAMRMMVIRPLIQSIFGGGGGGGIFSIFGGVTGTKASGGTMMAGEPYLVGERGPELVIPSRSGTVMNADLTNKAMAGGNQKVQVEVFVNDNGNFDARVREVSSSVVAKAAPRIIQGAERQILDQRRRGGVMKATF